MTSTSPCTWRVQSHPGSLPGQAGTLMSGQATATEKGSGTETANESGKGTGQELTGTEETEIAVVMQVPRQSRQHHRFTVTAREHQGGLVEKNTEAVAEEVLRGLTGAMIDAMLRLSPAEGGIGDDSTVTAVASSHRNPGSNEYHVPLCLESFNS